MSKAYISFVGEFEGKSWHTHDYDNWEWSDDTPDFVGEEITYENGYEFVGGKDSISVYAKAYGDALVIQVECHRGGWAACGLVENVESILPSPLNPAGVNVDLNFELIRDMIS